MKTAIVLERRGYEALRPIPGRELFNCPPKPRRHLSREQASGQTPERAPVPRERVRRTASRYRKPVRRKENIQANMQAGGDLPSFPHTGATRSRHVRRDYREDAP